MTTNDLINDSRQKPEEKHPLDFVKPTQLESNHKTFWAKHRVKVLSVLLLVLVFIFLSDYEHTIHHENIEYKAPLPQAIVNIPSNTSAQAQVQPQPLPKPSAPSMIQITKDQPVAPGVIDQPEIAVPAVVPAVIVKPASPTSAVKQISPPINPPISNISYHWQIMASSQASHLTIAIEHLGISAFKPYVLTKQVQGKTLYTLNIGTFNTKNEAESMLKQLPPSLVQQKLWLVKTVA